MIVWVFLSSETLTAFGFSDTAKVVFSGDLNTSVTVICFAKLPLATQQSWCALAEREISFLPKSVGVFPDIS